MQKIYDLEARTLEFSKRLIRMGKVLPKDDVTNHLKLQGIRSGTSVGANYREANDALGKKDFLHRMKISRKEAKETSYWLELIIEHLPDLETRIQPLLGESNELVKILSSIVSKTEGRTKQEQEHFEG